VRALFTETEGAGAITESSCTPRREWVRAALGAGGITFAARVGAVSAECNPSADGAAGVDLKARRLATSWLEDGSLRFGASTTLAASELPRAIRIDCVRSAEIFGARQFVAGVVDHFVGLQPGSGVGAKAVDLAGKKQGRDQQQKLQEQRRGEAAIGKLSVSGFTGEARPGTGESGSDRSNEFFPARRPLHQELGAFWQLADGRNCFELESVAQLSSRLCYAWAVEAGKCPVSSFGAVCRFARNDRYHAGLTPSLGTTTVEGEGSLLELQENDPHESRLRGLLHSDLNPVTQCSFRSGYRVAG
jgi:hypothetical protein